MEQTLTLNSVSLAVKFYLPVCTFRLSLVMPSSSVTLSLKHYFSFFGLFVAPAEACERHTVVSLCGLSEECFDQSQINSYVLFDTHCTAV